MFLEKYNLITIEEKMFIFNDNKEIYSDGSDGEYSDDSDDFCRTNRMKKIRCINLFK